MFNVCLISALCLVSLDLEGCVGLTGEVWGFGFQVSAMFGGSDCGVRVCESESGEDAAGEHGHLHPLWLYPFQLCPLWLYSQ